MLCRELRHECTRKYSYLVVSIRTTTANPNAVPENTTKRQTRPKRPKQFQTALLVVNYGRQSGFGSGIFAFEVRCQPASAPRSS